VYLSMALVIPVKYRMRSGMYITESLPPVLQLVKLVFERNIEIQRLRAVKVPRRKSEPGISRVRCLIALVRSIRADNTRN